MKPLAFRVLRYSTSTGDRSLELQGADTLSLCAAHDYEDGGYLAAVDESGNLDTRERQGKGAIPTLIWIEEKVAWAHRTFPGRPIRVVAWKDARLWRDVSEKERFRRILKKLPDAKTHTFDGLYDPRSANDTFRSTVLTAVDQQFSDITRENVIRAHNARRARGLPATGWAGYGHRVEGDDRSRWVVVPEEAEVLRDVARRVLGGEPLKVIARDLNARAIPTRFGGQWRDTSLRQMMVCARLAGILTHLGKELGKSDAIEPIIDESTYRRLQRHFITGKIGPNKGRQPLTGVLHCGKCGAKLNADRRRGDQRSYGCRKCGGSNIQAEITEDILTTILFATLEDPTYRAALHEDDDTSGILTRLASVEVEQADLEAAASTIPVKAYVAKATALADQLAGLHMELREATATTGAIGWIAQLPMLKASWNDLAAPMKRQIMLDVIGPYTVLPLPTTERGRHATRETVGARLREGVVSA